MVVCTVAAVAVVPLTIDLYTSEGSAAPAVDATGISGSTAVDVPSTPRVSGVADPAAPTAVDSDVDPEAAVAASSAPGPDDASAILGSLTDPVPAPPLPDTRTGEPTPSVLVPSPVPSPVPSTPSVADVDAVVELPLETASGGSTTGVTDAGAVEDSALIDSGAGSGMGGDLPPEVLPTPAYPQCPIIEAGSWWTDPADPDTCIPPYPIQFHEPTPPGIPPEVLEPIFEVPVAPDGSVGWYEPTPPGIDPSLLEPITEDAGQPGSGQ